MAGQEGFEPPTSGFGVRRSTVRATGLHLYIKKLRLSKYSLDRIRKLFRFAVLGMLPTKATIFAKLKFVRCRSFIFGCRVISLLTLSASKCYNNSHSYSLFLISVIYSMMSLTTPAPTVRPPSRIANRNSFSIAMGVINSAVTEILSPGITISTFSGSVTIPVTSVVRK